ncbi:Fc.00g019180.m01.CDS01 [Cosmosporella sp. VM-42]
MVVAGSDIAPFVAFAQERSAQSKSGLQVGKTFLLFGCRSSEQDFLHAHVWSWIDKEHDFFSIDSAFSRNCSVKKHIQHTIFERKEEILGMHFDDQACLYICGSFHIAQEVK